MQACGICNQNDINKITGFLPASRYGQTYPCTFGHEPTGDVVEVGSAVTDFEVGDRVLIRMTPGAFQEYGVSLDYVAAKISNTVDYVEGTIGQLIDFSLNAIDKCVKLGDDIYIAGQGPIGLVVTQLCRVAGAATIIVGDKYENRLKAATKLGADYTINVTEKDDVKELFRIMPEGVTSAIDCSGSVDGYSTCMKVLKKRRKRPGTILGALGFTHSPTPLDTLHLNTQRTTIVNVTEDYELETPQLMARTAHILEKKMIDCKSIVTHTFPLEELFTHALPLIRDKPEQVLKAVVTPWKKERTENLDILK
jgi:L-iditol 2-dehydrogenase